MSGPAPLLVACLLALLLPSCGPAGRRFPGPRCEEQGGTTGVVFPPALGACPPGGSGGSGEPGGAGGSGG